MCVFQLVEIVNDKNGYDVFLRTSIVHVPGFLAQYLKYMTTNVFILYILSLTKNQRSRLRNFLIFKFVTEVRDSPPTQLNSVLAIFDQVHPRADRFD